MAEGILAGTAFIDVVPNMAKFSAGLSSGIRKAGKQTTALGKSMSRNVTAPIVLAAGAAIKLGIDFDDTFRQMVGLAGVSRGAIAGLKEEVLKLAPAVGKSPEELARALYFIESSGISGSNALKVLRASAKASASGLGETEVVADAVTSAVNAYGAANLSAADAADVLSQAVELGKGEASAIAPVLGSILPLSSELGVKFRDVAGAIASMTRIGESVPRASTALQAFFSSLLKQTPKASKALHSVGLNFKGLREDLANKGLPYVLNLLKERFDGNIAAMANAFPNIRALRGLLALTGKNGKATAQIFDQMRESVGQNDKAFKATTEGSGFKFQQLLAQLQAAGIRLSTTLIPIAIQVADVLSSLTEKFDGLSPSTQKWIVYIALTAAALGPLLVIIGNVITVVGALVTVAGFLGAGLLTLAGIIPGVTVAVSASEGAMIAFGSALTLSLGPIGLVALGIVAIGTAIGGALYWMSRGSQETDILKDATNRAKDAVTGLNDALSGAKNAHQDLIEARHQQTSATHQLTRAEKDAATALKQHGRNSLEYKQAVDSVNASEDALRRTTAGAELAKVADREAQEKLTKKQQEGKVALDKLRREIVSSIKPLKTHGVNARFNTEITKHNNATIHEAAGRYRELAGALENEAKKLEANHPHLARLKRHQEEVANSTAALIDELNRLPTMKEINIRIDAHTFYSTSGSRNASARGGGRAGRAAGGPVDGDTPYIVGEKGPEVFVPDSNGHIIPNHRLQGGGPRAGGARSVLTITNWDEGTGYIEEVADGSVSGAAAHNRQRRRMRRGA